MKQLWLGLTFLALVLTACDGGFDVHPEGAPPGADEIVGGKDVPLGDVRGFYVAKLAIEVDGKTAFCTATHVSDTVLLTAAHCFNNANTKNVRVVYRTYGLSLQSRLIKKLVIHEDYKRNEKSDLAFIQIFGLKPNTQRILKMNFSRPKNSSFNLTSIGFGITNAKVSRFNGVRGGGVLRAVTTRVTGYSDNQEDMFIDMTEGKGVNHGDSGGPGIYDVNGEPTILGVARSVDEIKDGSTTYFKTRATYTPLSFHKNWTLKNLNALTK